MAYRRSTRLIQGGRGGGMKVLVVTNMYPTQDKPAFGVFVQEQVEALRKEGVEIDVLFVDGSRSKLNYIWGFFRFWGRLLKRRYDLIHAHYIFSGIIARAQFLYPVVLTHHGLEAFMTWQRIPSRLIIPFVNMVILVSQEQKEKLRCEKAEVIPCGVNFDLFKPTPKDKAREKLNLPLDKKLVLWVGQHTRPEKRFDIVQAAVAQARERDPSIELVLVSGQPHELVPIYCNACDVLPLVSDGEGSPMVIKEAMACNLPIVSVPVGDVPEVIGGTDGCYLCTQEPLNIAEKLHLALRNGKRTNGREKIKHLELSIIAKRIITLYREVLREKKETSERQPCRERGNKAKRACIVRHSYYPQHSHVRRDAETLLSYGYEVDIICIRGKGQASRETVNGVRVYRLPLQRHRKGILRYIFQYSAFFFLVFWQLTWLSLKSRYQVVEIDSPPDFVIFAAIIPKILGAKIIFFVFDHEPEVLMEQPMFGPDHWAVKILHLVERNSARWADYTIGTQIINKQILEGHGVPRSKISVVLNVPDDSIFDYHPSLTNDNSIFRVITHGSLLERYGVQTLIRTVPLLIEEIPNLKVNIVGDGEYRPQLEQLAQSMLLVKYIDFIGFVPRDEVLKYIAEADIGVVTILSKINPMLPNKLFEYLAMGKPVVTTSIPTIKAYFDHNSVKYYEPDNERDLAGCILELYRNREKRAALAAAGWASYQKYRWTKMKHEYLSVYDKLTNKG
jgi:glycosyltransferase involved in cell wall biosynthesis